MLILVGFLSIPAGISGGMESIGQFYVVISQVTSVHNIKIIWDDQFPNPVTKNIVYPEVLLD